MLAVRGLSWLNSPEALLRQATDAAAGRIPTGWELSRLAQLRPTLAELGAQHTSELADAVHAFSQSSRKAAELLPVRAFDATGVSARIHVICERLTSQVVEGDLELVWNLATCPADTVPLIVDAAAAKSGGKKAIARITGLVRSVKCASGSQTELELASSFARELRAVTLACRGIEQVLSVEESGQLEEHAARKVAATLGTDPQFENWGTCQQCDKECAPWHSSCNKCFGRRDWY